MRDLLGGIGKFLAALIALLSVCLALSFIWRSFTHSSGMESVFWMVVGVPGGLVLWLLGEWIGEVLMPKASSLLRFGAIIFTTFAALMFFLHFS